MWDYSEKVKEHFFRPHNVGEVENPDGMGEVGSLACGDALRLTFKLDAEGRIDEVKFKTFGCGSAIASSSALTDLVKGKTLKEAEKVTNQDIADFLGGLPEQKMHCSVMGREALVAAIENYRTGTTVRHDLEGTVICRCFGITDHEIEQVVRENNLRTVTDVTNYCKAGGGCESCHGDIQRIIDGVSGKKPEPEAPPAPSPAKPLTTVQKIKLIEKTLDEQVRPALQADGGDLELIDLDGDRVVIALRGMCAHCAAATVTLKDVVEAKLREFVDPAIVVAEEQA